MSQSEAWVALHTTISAKLKYPLPDYTFTKEECKSIMCPVFKAGLPKCGISTNMARKVRDGPVTNGGGGMLVMFHYQGTSRTAMIVEQWHTKTTAGEFLEICIEYLGMEIGWYG